MSTPTRNLADDALTIWQAGVAAVASEKLMANAVQLRHNVLVIGDEDIDLNSVRKIVVVGAGKAGAGMAAAIESILGPAVLEAKQVTGWINVPADCVRPLERIHLHAGRPAGFNEPTAEGVRGSEEIVRLVAGLQPDDLCLCLISGGGSALLPAPVEGITLADKLSVTRHLSASGANIRELNTVRKQLSRIKGGALARACRAGRMRTLIISDVLGDPLDLIGSGPTVQDPSTAADALRVLHRYDSSGDAIPPAVLTYLQGVRSAGKSVSCDVRNLVIGNNAIAVAAAAAEAKLLGYSTDVVPMQPVEGDAETIGRELADKGVVLLGFGVGPECLISGGEPVVRLASASVRGQGGRNQQLVLAAAERLWEEPVEGIVILSGGTDGEDGPTDAAGAWVDARMLTRARELELNPTEYLRRNDAYHFFEPLGGLIRTGPTHTNVCDLRVVLVGRRG